MIGRRTTPVLTISKIFGSDLLRELSGRVVGQPNAMAQICHMFRCTRRDCRRRGGRAAVSFARARDGKDAEVEALADVLHGSQKQLLRVDCGEFQMEHEVAKLSARRRGIWGIAKRSRCSRSKISSVTSESSSCRWFCR